MLLMLLNSVLVSKEKSALRVVNFPVVKSKELLLPELFSKTPLF